jgi:hypothetical protein
VSNTNLERKSEPAEALKQPEKYDRNYRPPIVSDPKLAPLVNRYAKNRVTPDMFNRYPEAKPEDFTALLTVLSDTKDNDTVRHEVEQILWRSKCPDLQATLFKIFDNPEEQHRFREFVMQYFGTMALEAPEDSETRQILVAKTKEALNDKHFQVRSQALQNLCRLKDPVGIQTAVKWLTDYKPVGGTGVPAREKAKFDSSSTSVFAREAGNSDVPAHKTGQPEAGNAKTGIKTADQGTGKAASHTDTGKDARVTDLDFERGHILNQAIRCIGDLDLKEHLPTIRTYARDPNSTIRIAALVVLSNWNDTESIPAMQEAAESKDPLLQSCGKAALKRMQSAKETKKTTEN